MTNLVTEQYETGKLFLEGTLGHLTKDQEQLLRQLWKSLFESFESATDNLDSSANPELPTRAKKTKEEGTVHKSSSWFSLGKAKEEAEAYRQIVSDIAPESSNPPPFVRESSNTVREAFWNAIACDHPDVLLLRFLRARKWKVEDALNMMLSCLKWRLDEDIVALNWEGESRLNYALLQRGIGAIHQTDRIGQPVLYIPVKKNDPKAQPQDHMLDYTVYLMEVTRLFLHPPIEKVCLVFDTTDMSLANMDWTFFKTFLHYLEHYYPECLGLVLIYNASWVFNTLWKAVRPMLDPVVASKVQFASTKEDVLKFIPEEHLPTALGGADPWVFKYTPPVADENKPMFDAAAREQSHKEKIAARDEFESVTRLWAESGSGESAEEFVEKRNATAQKLIEACARHDVYVRARSQFHRAGIIDGLDVKW
ncbi:hypothetical protein EC988_002291 [Linderina pennispora]|nr:hypothetical protein EC988_002291 [Linderina pennispora]